ncbi:2-oxoglutarate-Fe(II) type oxidoreductase ppzD [Folsomia candida]|uniref:1-aminocyclopropane-1-carboxylate oxidase n=1 Tax=Folsomia candida TaxID=158441 RepID=A0A226E556_FOLCA|nr:2-oxoglutarate-Fe(II) type oxidoreductase ppzD [Folsomia candida]OXA51656.1 1-aminocyclopropane-1-carboxylate oxidase [Folsomia candida]
MKSEIPILDCSKISGSYDGVSDSDGFEEFAKQLGDGMSSIGFVYLTNHGVHHSIIDVVLRESRNFFELPKDVKMKYRKPDAVENFNGYTPAEDEQLNETVGTTNKSGHDYKEAWDSWGKEMLSEANYPSEVPGMKKSVDDFRLSLVTLCKKLFLCFGHYLKLEDPEFFLQRHRALDDLNIKSHNDIRTNYYMALNSSEVDEITEDAMRLNEHNDWGTVTFLVQDSVGGLEAKKTNGDWIPVPPIENSIVLNAGLMLEMWSGGHFPATGHRVRLLKSQAKTVRQSIGFFVQPDGESNCIPLVPEKKDWHPAYPKVDKETHFEYFRNRVAGSRAY